ncbi:MAG: aldo/keto reductase, partial [Dehalococcoidia bacterium]
MEMRALGGTSIRVSVLGVGVWSWGARTYWGYGRDFGLSDVEEAFQASIDAGLNFFDTAEIYAGGVSERILGDLVRKSGRELVVASKFAPLPWRVTARSLHKALDATLSRLGLEQVELYQVHFPFSLIRLDSMMQALADAVKAGKIRAVGVSNYGASKMRRAHEALARRGVPLAANQVRYSLLDRRPETNGVLDACRQLNVTLIAHTPLAQGLLTGKYRPGSLPRGV